MKSISLPSVPRVGEYIRFQTENEDDDYSWEIREIKHYESGRIEVWTELLDNIDDRMYSFESEDEFQEYYDKYIAAGWKAPYGIRENKQYKGKSSA